MSGVPKAELHCHIEGTAPSSLVRRLAARNGVVLPPGLFTPGGGFAWRDFAQFLDAYDAASTCIRTPADYRDIVHAYLTVAAAEGAIYVEFFASPDHAAAVGLDYVDLLAGLARGIDDALRDCGIVGRIVMTCIRHLGPDRALGVARRMLEEPHPYVVGFGMGGDERLFDPADFAPAFRLAAEAGLGCTAHAGEFAGPGSVRAVLDSLPVSRIGHGVRAVEDPDLLQRIAAEGVVLEVCPGSNLALGLYPARSAHPLRRLIEAGCRVTLNSDDPPYFATSIGHEYEACGLDRAALLGITRTAIEAAFVDDAMRAELLARLN